jgi:hypothetical protein
MAKVRDAREAKRMVRLERRMGDPEIDMITMIADRRGPEWVVKYNDQSTAHTEHEVHINAETGKRADE